MKVLITGATGFLGHSIARELLVRGHELVVVSRDAKRASESFPFPARFVSWNSTQDPAPAEALEKVESIVHLAGEPVAGGRWSEERKQRIRDSRVLGTRHLWQGLEQLRARGSGWALKSLIAGSAIGFYGDRGDEWLNESSETGKGFLAEVCRQWESEIFKPGYDEVRQVAIRTGVVLGRDGGALAKLLPIFRLGAGGPVGSGRQWMSWIHLEDIARIFVEAALNPDYRGVVNGVAPNPVTHGEFAKELGKALKRPAIFPAPAAALRLAMGEMSSIVLDSQRVKPEKLQRQGFEFKYVSLDTALHEICAPQDDPADQLFEADQWIPRPVEEIFPFFSEAKNLGELTPPWLGFEIREVSAPDLATGTLIDYRIKIHGVPLHWRTRIEQWQPNRNFVDNQLKGPYAKWHHTHTFVPVPGGTLMRDRVLYRLPLGALGKSVAHWKVRRDIEEIFAYRRKRIAEIFA